MIIIIIITITTVINKYYYYYFYWYYKSLQLARRDCYAITSYPVLNVGLIFIMLC